MQLIEGQLVYSATDLINAASCEYASLRAADAALGWGDSLPTPTDAMQAEAGRLGDRHEADLLQTFIADLGQGTPQDPRGVVVLPKAIGDEVPNAAAQTARLAAAGAEVIHQAVLFDGRMVGFADFLIRRGAHDAAYDVADAKLARRARVSALIQIAAYGVLAERAGIPLTGTGLLLLGSGEAPTSDLARIIPVVAERRQRLELLLDEHVAAGAPVRWGHGTVSACGTCDVCHEQVEAHRDVLLVAGMRRSQRKRLRDAGVTTIDQLAAYDGPAGQSWPIPQRTLLGLRDQARQQLAQMPPPGGGEPGPVSFSVFDDAPLHALPEPSPGDLFFDFEGNPLWQDPATGDWGLEYLFGVVEANADGQSPRFRPFWAHTRDEERQALIDFLQYVRRRRTEHPDLHIYHYADYERAALLRLAVRHHTGEDEVDQLLREGVLVDLYPVVRRSIRISEPSYSIKKLEPLYMPQEAREGVTNAAESVVEYASYMQLRDSGSLPEAEAKLGEIARYNEFDCVSTLRLRDWLLGLAEDYPCDEWEEPAPGADTTDPQRPESNTDEAALAEPLFERARAQPGSLPTPGQSALSLIAASVGYHRREEKPFWWTHFDRLGRPLDEITDRGAMILDDVRVTEAWHRRPRARKSRRKLLVTGSLPPGSDLAEGDAFLLYEPPVPAGLDTGGRQGNRGYTRAKVLAVSSDPHGRDVLEVEETAPTDEPDEAMLPTVIAANNVVRPGPVREALWEVAGQVLERLRSGSSPDQALPAPVADLLLRRPPRLRGARALPRPQDDDYVGAITEAVQLLDRSALAVQGPPGAGKTHVGSHVIKALVDGGWRIGVVSQGHTAVNHMLDKVVTAGVPAARVAKKKRPQGASWVELEGTGPGSESFAAFLDRHAGVGCVVGGTAWDFANPKRVARGQLDLLVIDEAGQYSLAGTIAVSVSAQRLLLLGDPQQLPQVSQGAHPAPVHASALGWLSPGMTLPDEFGYFLQTTWRLHPAIAERVSAHSYAGRLRAHRRTSQREMLDAHDHRIPPGVFVEQVEHRDNDVRSDEEVARVADLVREALTWWWHDPEHHPRHRPVRPDDILVVTPFNAQRNALRAALADSGMERVRVGTVDKFQGQEAPVCIISMCASSPEEVPRGMGFLLSPNRINVAVSRAQWRAVIVRSPHLTDYMPPTPEALDALGSFLMLGPEAS